MRCFAEKRKLKRRLAVFLCMVLVVVSITTYALSVIKPIILNYCIGDVTKQILLIANESVVVTLDKVNGEELYNIEYDKNSGDVLLFSANSIALSILTKNVVDYMTKRLEEVSNRDVKIPLGALSGFATLADKGREISYSCLTVASVNSNTKSSFEAVGINQTKLKITSNITIGYDIIVPYNEFSSQISVPVVLAESVITGKIPEVFIDGESGMDYLDLIP